MPAPDWTIDELVEALKRSQLPTVVLEGKEDIYIGRVIEDSIVEKSVDCIPVGGRSKAIELIKRRHEYANIQCAFLLDRDLWIFLGCPEFLKNCNEAVLTNGSSIENDLIVDGNIENLMTKTERVLYFRDLNTSCEWYSYWVNEAFGGSSDVFIATSVEEFCDRASGGFRAPYLVKYPGIKKCEPHFSKIFDEYQILLRGKTLAELLIRYLAGGLDGRTSRYSYENILEIGARSNGANSKRIVNEVKRILGC